MAFAGLGPEQRQGSMAAIGAAVEALRPKQWVKNVLVLAPVLLGRRFTDGDTVATSLVAFATFSLHPSSMS